MITDKFLKINNLKISIPFKLEARCVCALLDVSTVYLSQVPNTYLSESLSYKSIVQPYYIDQKIILL